MRLRDLDTTVTYAAPGTYFHVPARPLDTRLWTLEQTGPGKWNYVLAPHGARQCAGQGPHQTPVGVLVLTTQGLRTTRQRYGSLAEAAQVIASQTIPPLPDDPDQAARHARAHRDDFELGGLRVTVMPITAWQAHLTWDELRRREQTATTPAPPVSDDDRPAHQRTLTGQPKPTVSPWGVIARLARLDVNATPRLDGRGNVTHITLTVDDLARLLDGPAADPRTLLLGTPRTGFTHRGVSYCVIEEQDSTFGVWRTDSPGDFIVRGRLTASTAQQDAIADVDSLLQALQPPTAGH